jgi:hypothetical protein
MPKTFFRKVILSDDYEKLASSSLASTEALLTEWQINNGDTCDRINNSGQEAEGSVSLTLSTMS